MALKWKALALKSKAQKGLFKEIEEEESRSKGGFDQVKALISGTGTGKDATKMALATASVAAGGGAGSSAAANNLKKFLGGGRRESEVATESSWKTVKKAIIKNPASPVRSPTRSPTRKLGGAAAEESADEESAARLALIQDARKIKSPGKMPQMREVVDADIGQRKVGKGKKLQDALPLIPNHLKKKLVGGKEHANADKDFYRVFKYIYVDIPEAEEDFPSESVCVDGECIPNYSLNFLCGETAKLCAAGVNVTAGTAAYILC